MYLIKVLKAVYLMHISNTRELPKVEFSQLAVIFMQKATSLGYD